VSHTCRDNLILRAKLSPKIIRVIPNAIDPSKFTPDLSQRHSTRVKVVVVSRLVYRKGVDLLVGIIPAICIKDPIVDFIIGGDGSKRLELQEMVERHGLEHRVEFLGAVPHANVRNVLCRGHIFLNCSLTESFCIAILEAACCGLLVVSTNVGGVPEVLPHDLIYLADPQVAALVQNLKKAIAQQRKYSMDPWKTHERIKDMYSWGRVARETVQVYRQVSIPRPKTLLERLDSSYRSIGGIAGSVVCFLLVSFELLLLMIEWWQPKESIDILPDFVFEPDQNVEETATGTTKDTDDICNKKK
jgi:phosphatidylinositol N-acetylglucosaminyltransferase subunit A